MNCLSIMRALVASTAVGVAGCANFDDPESALFGLGGDRVTAAGVNQAFPEEFETVDLIEELDPDRRRAIDDQPDHEIGLFDAEVAERRDLLQLRGADPAEGWWIEFGGLGVGTYRELDPLVIRELSGAFRAFYEYPQSPELRRNRLQDRLIAASEQRCGLYRTYLRRFEAENEFWLGSLATLLGGLGSIFTDASVARALSGAAGVTSGVRAEARQAYLSNLASEVILTGIDQVRGDMLQDIYSVRDTLPGIDTYTVEAAIADSIRYHSACSAYVGMAAASSAIEEYANPGIATVVRMQVVSRLLEGFNDAPTDANLTELESALSTFNAQLAGPVITPISAIRGSDPLTRAVSALASLERVSTRLRDLARDLGLPAQQINSITTRTSNAGDEVRGDLTGAMELGDSEAIERAIRLEEVARRAVRWRELVQRTITRLASEADATSPDFASIVTAFTNALIE